MTAPVQSQCGWCRKPLPVKEGRGRPAKFCNQVCGDRFRNHQRSVATLRAKKAVRRLCKWCNGLIPPERRASAVFCSYQCKQDAGNVPNDRRREWNRAYMLSYRHGITADDYDTMLVNQGGVCAICGTDQPGGRRSERFHVDHDHETGEVRGLLCNECNQGLGKFQDSVEMLRAAIQYLARSSP